MRSPHRVHRLCLFPLAAVLACSSKESSAPAVLDASIDDATPEGAAMIEPAVPVTSETVSRRTDVEQMMFAAGEMQISGEPFAENFVGRNLDGYDRFKLPTNLYDSDQDPATDNDEIDLVGFSTAVESYEYSKYHMNI